MILLGIAMLGGVGLAWEDFKHRTVHLWWYIILAIGLAGLILMQGSYGGWLLTTVINLLFVLVLLLILTIYFSIKEKKLVNLFVRHLGWGDVLFFLVITPYFSLMQYILFTVASLIIALLLTPIIFRLQGKNRHVPLAGIQATCLVVYLPLAFFELFSLPIYLPN
ncbi:hypothetical protein HP439_18405 [Sphingobacterium shayense]|uniref:hypothetical protein n=1 Tax=Sphingobacterium shayense TaxID=626343 RepID=UPI001551EE97|nr:hypothetical protein [Sphingobacterium shayense]NQD72699.1 hypothetical protein [Sphingobacterium shayense]